MTHQFNRRMLCISTAILAIAGSVPFTATAQAADTIKLGIVAPMSGPNARYGGFSMHGAELAVKDINDAGGVNGIKIQLFNADSQGTPVEGVSATRRLIDQEGVDFIIGDVSSSVTLAMQPVAEDAEVLLLNAASSNPKITYQAGVGGFKWTYRNYPTDENRALVVAKYA
ncbi:ABC transporter substrate-binding protein, partial [Neorhizobium galegae]